MNSLRRAGRQTFRSWETPNFRKYFLGQLVSASGSWVQQTALVWLVARDLTDANGVAVGMVVALQFLPVLIGGAWAGVLADRLDKRKVLFATSAMAAVFSTVLGVIVLADVAELWMVYVLAAGFGATTALDSPARRSFVTELVPDHHAANAVSLNSAVFTSARVIGPALAGLLIATVGIGWCFIANALSFVAVVGALLALDLGAVRPVAPAPRRKGQVGEGLRYVWGHPALRTCLVMTAVIGTMAYNFQVTLSLMARKVFDGDAGTFAMLSSLMAAAAVVASLFVAHRERVTTRFVVVAALALGTTMAVAASMPSLPWFALMLIPVGLSSISFISSAGAVAQSRAEPEYRGRVAALFAVAFLGSTPIGAPIVGAVSQAFGPRWGLWIGAAAALITGVLSLRALNARRDARAAAAPTAPATA